MSKMSTEKLQSNIASADARIQKILDGKAAAQAKLDKADAEIREIEVTRGYYADLLEARGVAVDGVGSSEPEADEEPQFG